MVMKRLAAYDPQKHEGLKLYVIEGWQADDGTFFDGPAEITDPAEIAAAQEAPAGILVLEPIPAEA